MSTEVLSAVSPDFSTVPAFAIAFQPIVDVANRSVMAYEALTRGVQGVSYPELIASMDSAMRRRFDLATADHMIRRSLELGLLDSDARLCINIEPEIEKGALSAAFIRESTDRHGMPRNRVVLELTENHKVSAEVLRQMMTENENSGFATAMDDFGAGYAGLSMLAECRPQILKLDRALVQGIDHCDTRQKLVRAFANVCQSLGMEMVAEGVETRAEYVKLRRIGIRYMQGYLFARPEVDALPQPNWEALRSAKSQAQLLPRIGAWMQCEPITLPA
ncbi:EAL domain, c-di-GMP-specific phosphodiesterase class I (or its enzymatically inactive variant) [Granulicella rosea]|uniref:EAL domain, c-di-GMP-specific phosphodiesterase class I (Or its enzymatically inactive variant) n=1 Tax=Granulicella rosea TaxID=474952 RepID=A0A239HMC7_9BACT|nr:EAL domain-containing protein [Granulicella rosea]SNS82003.1 EAL domain, c-di-GMP-specific phosphodiesterase class I (or its enzymatically inactive variant) [Granulicella rosea]